jgi:hypothetical protein
MTGRVSERWRELQACRERSTQLESGGERKVKEGLSPRCLKDVIITGIRRVGGSAHSLSMGWQHYISRHITLLLNALLHRLLMTPNNRIVPCPHRPLPLRR